MIAQQSFACDLIAAVDPELLLDRARQLKLNLAWEPYDSAQAANWHQPGIIKVLPVKLAEPARCGQLNAANAPYVLSTIKRAARGCKAQEFDALVTGPVQKSVINQAGIAFSGHTEYLAELTGGYPVMMLAAPGLRVALATTHLPLRKVSAALNTKGLCTIIRIIDHDLRHHFGIAMPRILVCGLNPHAGEDGHLGREEIDIIVPALKRLRGQGLHLTGPLPADTLFTPKYLEQADAVLAMYHDQGLPVLKYLGFGKAVNITLGLPIIRTSVDHGTALDLAGSGRIDSGSLRAAIDTALTMLNARIPQC